MKLEVLVSTMFLKNHDLIEKMNISTDVIIINQCDKFDYDEINLKDGSKIRIYSLDERGIGLSRNTALMRAKDDIVLFADDDLSYIDGYDKLILDEFKRNPKADLIIFNIETKNNNRSISYKNKKMKRIHKYNCLKYGCVRIAARRNKLIEKNITFSLLFGGGAPHLNGEDSLFIYQCINEGLKVYTSPETIAVVDFSTSSWFDGYNEKFFIDKGVLFNSIFGRVSKIISIPFLIKNNKKFKSELTFNKRFLLMLKGINLYNRR